METFALVSFESLAPIKGALTRKGELSKRFIARAKRVWEATGPRRGVHTATEYVGVEAMCLSASQAHYWGHGADEAMRRDFFAALAKT
jgi:hypothetical protein